jgi:hypothetical protein
MHIFYLIIKDEIKQQTNNLSSHLGIIPCVILAIHMKAKFYKIEGS